jgi:hypothetical protein
MGRFQLSYSYKLFFQDCILPEIVGDGAAKAVVIIVIIIAAAAAAAAVVPRLSDIWSRK